DCRFATCPTSRSPLLVKATTDGVVRFPSEFGMTLASPPSITATTLLVVPKSIPMILLTGILLLLEIRPERLQSKTLAAESQFSPALYLTDTGSDLFQLSGRAPLQGSTPMADRRPRPSAWASLGRAFGARSLSR